MPPASAKWLEAFLSIIVGVFILVVISGTVSVEIKRKNPQVLYVPTHAFGTEAANGTTRSTIARRPAVPVLARVVPGPGTAYALATMC
eukprot:1874619-Rhodomonas_salina.3